MLILGFLLKVSICNMEIFDYFACYKDKNFSKQ